MKGNKSQIQYFLFGMLIASCFFLIFGGQIIWPETSSELASWVQAIGSVIAIIVAIFIVNFEVKQQRKTKLENDKELRKLALEVVRKCCDYAAHAPSCFLNEKGKFENNLRESSELELIICKLENSLNILNKFALSGNLSAEQTFKALVVSDSTLHLLYLFKLLREHCLTDETIINTFRPDQIELIDLEKYFKEQLKIYTD